LPHSGRQEARAGRTCSKRSPNAESPRLTPGKRVEMSLRTPDVAPELRAVKENELTHSSPHPIVTVVVAGNSPRINRRNISQRRSFKRIYAQGGRCGFPETPGSRLSHRWRVEGELTPGSTTSGVRSLDTAGTSARATSLKAAEQMAKELSR
jgi:hypothetical protein